MNTEKEPSQQKVDAGEFEEAILKILIKEFYVYDTIFPKLEDHKRAAKEIVALAQLQQPTDKWISVSERLPEDQQDILFVLDGEIKSGTFWEDQDGKPDLWTYYDVDGTNRLYYPFEPDGITHWQPLPQAPAVNEK